MKITPLVAGVMKVAVFSAAFAIPGTAMASASIIPDQSTSGNGSILGGNAINLPVSAPIDVCGNGVGVLGTALGGCSGGASVNNSRIGKIPYIKILMGKVIILHETHQSWGKQFSALNK